MQKGRREGGEPRTRDEGERREIINEPESVIHLRD